MTKYTLSALFSLKYAVSFRYKRNCQSKYYYDDDSPNGDVIEIAHEGLPKPFSIQAYGSKAHLYQKIRPITATKNSQSTLYRIQL